MAILTIELDPGETLTITVSCDGDSSEPDPEPDEIPEEVEREYPRAVGH